MCFEHPFIVFSFRPIITQSLIFLQLLFPLIIKTAECNFVFLPYWFCFVCLISRSADGVICDAFNYCSHDKSSITRQMFPAEGWHQNQGRDEKTMTHVFPTFPKTALNFTLCTNSVARMFRNSLRCASACTYARADMLLNPKHLTDFCHSARMSIERSRRLS